MHSHWLTPRILTPQSVLSVLWLIGWAGVAHASDACLVNYEFYSYEPKRILLLERSGGDCQGTAILDVSISADSVRLSSLTVLQSTSFDSLWESRQYTRGVSSQICLSGCSWRVIAPDSIARTSPATNQQKRPPTFVGFNAEVVYWLGCGKYENYLLKTAFADLEEGLLYIVTASNWDWSIDGPPSGCDPGDGLLICRFSPPKSSSKK